MNQAPTANTGSTTTFYSERLAEASSHLARLIPLSRRISWLRLGAFLIATVSFFEHAWSDRVGFPWVAMIGGCAGVAFVALVIWHRKVAGHITRWENLKKLCQEGMARIERRFQDLQPIPVPRVEDPLGRSNDLDILGDISLYRLTGGAYTVRGQETLANWLMRPASTEEVALRQEVVTELRSNSDALLNMGLLGMGLDKDPEDPEGFLKWAEGEPWLRKRPGILWSARILGALPMLLAICSLMGWVQLPLWLVAMVVNLGFTGIFAPKVHRIFGAVSMHKGALEHFSRLFNFVSKLSLKAPRAKGIQEQLKTGGLTAHKQMNRLERISSFADLRFSAMMYFPIQMFTLLDFHVLCRMERWQVRVGTHARVWLDALGEAEALMALATLAHDNPHYTMPRVVEDEVPCLVSKGLGHPLLPPSTCVTNDVDLGEPGRFLLVTGSNMSGKSSLLRSIGLNAALAGAGGSVHADELTTTPFVLGTSFRVVDSISDGVSFFMAELKRLKEIVNRAEKAAASQPPLLFLLDEILQGTNIIERRIAVAGVLRHLVRLGCLGAISSHDLTLADADGIGARADTVYFTESFRDGENGREMVFDFILRPGLAPSSNALELLRLVGLDIENGKSGPHKG